MVQMKCIVRRFKYFTWEMRNHKNTWGQSSDCYKNFELSKVSSNILDFQRLWTVSKDNPIRDHTLCWNLSLRSVSMLLHYVLHWYNEFFLLIPTNITVHNLLNYASWIVNNTKEVASLRRIIRITIFLYF